MLFQITRRFSGKVIYKYPYLHMRFTRLIWSFFLTIWDGVSWYWKMLHGMSYAKKYKLWAWLSSQILKGKLLFCNWLQPLDCDALHDQWIMSSHNEISYPEGF